tara:strand:+ start:40 stop:504 length:465 start_codon:yes stop_codon:yes gene_type:complete
MLESALLFASGLAVFPTVRLIQARQRRRKRLKLIKETPFEVCNIGDCQVQLSVVVKAPQDEGAWNRFEDALRSLLDHNFDTMSGAYHRFPENPVATYTFIGHGADAALELHAQIEHIMNQEKLQFHLITVKEMGENCEIFGYRSLKELDKLTAW